MGSKDRRTMSDLVYQYFRLGHILKNESPITRLAIACFLCEKKNSPILTYLLERYPSFLEKLNQPLETKFQLLKASFPDFDINDLFPFSAPFSKGIDKLEFLQSHFIQPNLWIRTRTSYRDKVQEELLSKDISFTQYPMMSNAICLANRTNLDTLESNKRGYFEVQDLSSQKTGNFIDTKPNQNWWDCCSGSGGKSLMIIDKEPSIRLHLSDTREGILQNLKLRINKVTKQKFPIKQANLTNESNPLPFSIPMDGIIADVPCSGSGTWSRTPENIYFITQKEIESYHNKQKKIIKSALPALKNGGELIYITCSVFESENEAVVNELSNDYNLELVNSQAILGYQDQADSMFIAKLRKK